VIVTGGAMGIGFGIARRLVEGGAHVLLADLSEEAATAAVGRLQAGPGRVIGMQLDVAAPDAGERLVEAAIAHFGGVDVLVNNAGIFPMATALEMEPSLFERIQAVNVHGLVFISQAVARRMIEQGGGGRIVNIASIDAVHPSMVGLAGYDTSKGAVLMFTRSLALELGPHGILVNAIAPGGIDTEGTSRPLGADMTVEEMDSMMAEFKQRIPLGRMGLPDDIATAVVFLSSSAASYITGSLLVIDGGRLLT
jgi:2-deoxy-D-gluconate 3-dehydrogenase